MILSPSVVLQPNATVAATPTALNSTPSATAPTLPNTPTAKQVFTSTTSLLTHQHQQGQPKFAQSTPGKTATSGARNRGAGPGASRQTKLTPSASKQAKESPGVGGSRVDSLRESKSFRKALSALDTRVKGQRSRGNSRLSALFADGDDGAHAELSASKDCRETLYGFNALGCGINWPVVFVNGTSETERGGILLLFANSNSIFSPSTTTFLDVVFNVGESEPITQEYIW